MRSIFSRKCARAVALAVSLCAAATGSVRADDRAAIDDGRTAARGILLVGDPRACGIVLLRERCIADVDAFLALHGKADADYAHVPKIGPHPASGLRAFVADGDRDGFDFALAWYNNVQAGDRRWAGDARAAALFDAGVLNVLAPTARGNTTAAALWSVGPVMELSKHNAQIPAGTLPVDTSPLKTMYAEVTGGHPNLFRMPGVVPFANALAAAVGRTLPQRPLAAVPQTDAPAADAAFGVVSATLSELIDSPRWIAQDDAQALATALADRLDALVPANHAEVDAFRAQVRKGSTYDSSAASRAFSAATTAFERSVPRDRGQRFAVAAAAAQLGYNAAVLRSSDASTVLLQALGAPGPLDDAIPGWSAARGGAAAIGASDWAAQHAYSLLLVSLIERANAA
jgi:hypothetical protein